MNDLGKSMPSAEGGDSFETPPSTTIPYPLAFSRIIPLILFALSFGHMGPLLQSIKFVGHGVFMAVLCCQCSFLPR